MFSSRARGAAVLLFALVTFTSRTGAQIAPPADLPGSSLQRTSLADHARNPGAAVPPRFLAANGGSAPLWDNGPLDTVTAHLSQRTSVGDFLAADDSFIKDGFWACVDSLTVCFAVSDSIDGVMTKPSFGLTIYDDCSGRPDTVAFEVTDPELISASLVGPSAFAGYNLWNVTFEINQFTPGYRRLWIGAYGIGELQDAEYYWLSANNGVIQGAQAQLKNGAEPWMDAQQCDCPGICTDLCFAFDGHICCLAKDNTPFDPKSGSKSLQLKGATIDTARAVDNFQITPDEPQLLCAVQAWVATNCPVDKFYLEIYENVCNMPGAKLFTIDDVGPQWNDVNGQTYQGVPIYRLFWKLDGPSLDPGKDYWLSVVGRGTGSIQDKAFWMHLISAPCNINITEGKVKDPFVPGLEDFTFVSVATGGRPLDFAFRLWTRPDVATPPVAGACCSPQVGCVDTGVTVCTIVGGEFFPGENCAAFLCPLTEPTGACCAAGVCMETTQADCQIMGGAWQQGAKCTTNSCPGEVGACCLPNDSCSDLTESECTSMAGSFNAGVDCVGFSCPHNTAMGACCLSGEGCMELTESDCASFNGTYLGDDTTCSTDTCAAHLGACCLGNAKSVVGCVDDFLEADCGGFQGTYAGAGVGCETNPCEEPTGACCLPAAHCLDNVTQSECDSLFGSFAVDSTCASSCSAGCCFADGTCLDLTPEACNAADGSVQTEECLVAHCPQPPSGACCFDNGACSDVTEATCASSGGAFNTGACATFPCPQPTGACCLPTSPTPTCIDLDDDMCSMAGGTLYQNADCATFGCPQAYGACCFADGSCTETSQAGCLVAGGNPKGGSCINAMCPSPLGACCLGVSVARGSGCIDNTNQADCDLAGGTFYVDTDCSSGPCFAPIGDGPTSSSGGGSGDGYMNDPIDLPGPGWPLKQNHTTPLQYVNPQ